MKLVIAKSNWEVPELPLVEFLSRSRAEGFDAVELFLPSRRERGSELHQLVASHGLLLIAQASTEGQKLSDHMWSLRQWYTAGVEAGAIAVNFHSGSDFFSKEQNLELFEFGQGLVSQHGVPLLHETHRGRALFSLPDTLFYLDRIPSLRLTADFSHWFCVHESDLLKVDGLLDRAIQAASHIHARVGYSEGPQVSDPRSPVFKQDLERFEALWERIVNARRSSGAAALTITPEFGPPPYMALHSDTGRPVADPWAINVWMRRRLLERFNQPL